MSEINDISRILMPLGSIAKTSRSRFSRARKADNTGKKKSSSGNFSEFEFVFLNKLSTQKADVTNFSDEQLAAFFIEVLLIWEFGDGYTSKSNSTKLIKKIILRMRENEAYWTDVLNILRALKKKHI